jgi:uncharacterized radical SAM superfamily Fe-S cluster-containing enzyme
VDDTPKMDKTQTAARFYFALTFQLANEDLTKFEQIDDMSLYLCLNTAALLKERYEKELEQIKKMEKEFKK